MKNKFLKKIITTNLLALSMITMLPICANAAWKSDKNGWWYTEGSSYATGWRNIDNNWYYFYNNGYMAHDTTIDGYYLNSAGAWTKNFDNSSVQIVKKYLTSIGTRIPTYVEIDSSDGNYDVVHCYEVISYPGEGSHTATTGWYRVDRQTGSIYDEILGGKLR